jgi:hypothetical protein
MNSRFFRLALIIVLVLLVAQVMQPYVFRLMFVATTPRPIEARGDLADLERSTIALFDKVSPSVVHVVGRQSGRAFSTEEAEGGVQSGTGFVWDEAGDIVTNNHVIAGTSEVAVKLASGEVIRADIVGTAPNYDLGVIRLRDPGRLPPPVAVGSSADLKVGQSAYAIGNPFGLDQSLTTGVISALSRRLPTSSGRETSNAIRITVREVEFRIRSNCPREPVGRVPEAGTELEHAPGADSARQHLDCHTDRTADYGEVALRALSFHLQQDRLVVASLQPSHVLLDPRIDDVVHVLGSSAGPRPATFEIGT